MLLEGSRPTRNVEGRPGSSLIEGGFGNRPRAVQTRRRKTAARAAAPLLVPLALALTLGVVLAVSSGGSHTTHVNQTTSSNSRP
jgi:hypothetical protein